MAPRFTIDQTFDFSHGITISNIDVAAIPGAFSMIDRINNEMMAWNGSIPMRDVFRILGVSLYVPEPLERMTEKWRFVKGSKMKIYSDMIVISGMVDRVDVVNEEKKRLQLLINSKFYAETADFMSRWKTNKIDEEEKRLKMLMGKEYYADNKPYCSCKDSYVVRLAIIDKVIFHDPATIVYWKDGTKTVVKCGPNDTYSKETGLALCFMKKVLGNKGNYNDVFRKWIKEENHD